MRYLLRRTKPLVNQYPRNARWIWLTMIDNLKKKTDQTKAKNAIQLFIKIMHKTALCCDNVLLSGWKREIPLNKAIYQVKTENVPNKKMLLFEIYLGDKIELNCSLVAKLDGFINNRNYLSSFITLHSQENNWLDACANKMFVGWKTLWRSIQFWHFFFSSKRVISKWTDFCGLQIIT